MPEDDYFPDGYFPEDDEYLPETFLGWVMQTLGAWGPALLLSAVASLVVVVLVLRRGRGPMAVAAMLLAVHVPFFIGVYAGIYHLIVYHQYLVMGPWRRAPGNMALVVSEALFIPLAAIFLMIPGYATALVGAVIKSLQEEGQPPTASKTE